MSNRLGQPSVEQKKTKDTFFNIKWYHLFWLWIPAYFYAEVALGVTYNSTVIILQLLGGLGIKDYLDFSSAHGGAENGIDSVLSQIFFLGLALTAIWQIFVYIQKIFSIDSKASITKRILIALFISLIVPVLLTIINDFVLRSPIF